MALGNASGLHQLITTNIYHFDKQMLTFLAFFGMR